MRDNRERERKITKSDQLKRNIFATPFLSRAIPTIWVESGVWWSADPAAFNDQTSLANDWPKLAKL